MGRKHNVDEVLRSLTKKGCIITGAQPITKQVTITLNPDKEKIEQGYKAYLKSMAALFEYKNVPKTIVVQAAYTINLENAKDLGNKSWGKIDFLVNYNGYVTINKEKLFKHY
jgi:hypothetical protein